MAINIKNLTKEYTRSGTTFKAVNDASLYIEPGDFVSIIGRSGSGKSTLINMIAGLINPTTGCVEVDGRDISSIKDREASKYRNLKIGYVPQGQSALASLTVLDNVRAPYHFFKKTGDSTVPALSLLEQVGISHLAKSYPKHLSGGELKRVSIARALINDPDYLIADEPTSDLDAQTNCEIMELIKKISDNGTAVLMVTHDLDVLSYAKRTFIMDSGVLTESMCDEL